MVVAFVPQGVLLPFFRGGCCNEGRGAPWSLSISEVTCVYSESLSNNGEVLPQFIGSWFIASSLWSNTPRRGLQTLHIGLRIELQESGEPSNALPKE